MILVAAFGGGLAVRGYERGTRKRDEMIKAILGGPAT